MPGGPKSSIPRQGVRLPARKNKLKLPPDWGRGTGKSRGVFVTVNTVRKEKFPKITDCKSKGIKETKLPADSSVLALAHDPSDFAK